MEGERAAKLAALPMVGGDGLNSYAKNSTAQREVIDVAKILMSKAIVENLDIIIPSKSFSIADLGCSVGSNTIASVANIIEAVELKYQSLEQTSEIPEFQVFFNDQTSNDFNTLFKYLPQDKNYYAAGVPGSFYDRIFPSASLHLVHSSFSIHWLSQVPKEVMNKSSSCWNKGRVYYSNAEEEVVKAYKAQSEKDVEKFLQARAQEVVAGGLMVLTILGIPNATPHSECWVNKCFEFIGDCLMDMARKGRVNEEKVNSFNIPIYLMCPEEFEKAVNKNGDFSLERMEILPSLVNPTSSDARQIAFVVRAAFEELIKQEFGGEIIEHLFESYLLKITEYINSSSLHELFSKTMRFLVVLKHKPSDYY